MEKPNKRVSSETKLRHKQRAMRTKGRVCAKGKSSWQKMEHFLWIAALVSET